MILRPLTALLFACLLGLVGCRTSQEGVTNTLGTIKTVLEAPPDRVLQAAERTAEDMRLEIVTSRATAIDGRLECRTANSRPILIKTTSAGEGVSKVSIKVGSGFGDEALSLRILNEIRQRL